MPIEQNLNAPPNPASTSPSTTTPAEATSAPVSGIENEIPTYRAISPQAVLSLLCGVLAIFSFSHWIFLLCAGAAILLGILAERKIARLPEVLTGRGIAQAGIALGLIFGLSSVTMAAVQDWIVVREATKFARTYEDVLNKGTEDEAIWWGQAPVYRTNKTPEELANELRKSRPASGLFDLEQAALKQLKQRLADGGARAHFSRFETHGLDKLEAYATALYEIEPTGSRPIPEEERYAMALFKGAKQKGRYEWWVEQVAYPYKLASFQMKVEVPDDGHGHAH